jgi:phage portal protein BeeE
MGLIREYRTSLENPQTPLSYPAEWLLDIFNGGRTDSGIRVSEMTALQVSTIFACVEIKAGAVGFLDLQVHERSADIKGRLIHRLAWENELFDLLEFEPNPEMSSFTMRKTVQAHRMLWGNGYIEIERDRSSKTKYLWPRNPARIRPHRATKNLMIRTSDGLSVPVMAGDLIYLTSEGVEQVDPDPENPRLNSGPDRPILPQDILHMPGLSLDGRLGQNTINLARQAVGLALATEKFGAKFFGNGAVGFGVFEVPGIQAPEDRETTRRSIRESWGGENLQSPLVLEGGMKYTPTSTKPNEGQFLETRELQIVEQCRYFGVPPHMVGVTDKTNRANTEQIGLEFLTFGLNPDLKAWQQEIKRKLFPQAAIGRSAKKVFVALFDTSPLVMPDAESQRNFINSLIQSGVMSQNDGRVRLKLNPLDDEAADSHWIQINMQPLDAAFKLGAQATADGNEGAAPDAKSDKSKGNEKRALLAARIARAYYRLFRDAFGRVCRRSQPDPAALQQAFLPVFLSVGEELEQLAAAEFNTESNPDELAGSKFLADYFAGMHTRVDEWKSANGNAEQVAQLELARAVKAISIEIYRSVATRRAKEQNKILTSPELAEVEA